jgi:hypothetical protein
MNLKQEPFQIWNINFCKTHSFSRTKICQGTLSNMMSTQSGKFEKFEFWVLVGISSNTGRSKSNEIKDHWCSTVGARPCAVAMLSGLASVESSTPRPDPGREKGREKEKHTQDPPPRNLLFRAMPTVWKAPEETHSPPRPNQQPPSTRAWTPWPERACNAARTPAASSFWPSLSPSLRPI